MISKQNQFKNNLSSLEANQNWSKSSKTAQHLSQFTAQITMQSQSWLLLVPGPVLWSPIGTRRSTQSCEMSNLFHRENTEINLHPLWSHVWTNIFARFVTFCNIAMHCTGSEKQSQLGCGKITKTHLVPLLLPPFQLLEPNCAVLLVAGGKVKQLVETARLRSGWK